jgi:hypothetical protein
MNFKLKFLILSFLLVSFPLFITAEDLTSTSFIIDDPIIGTGGGYGTSTNFQLISAGHTLLSGYATSASFIAKYGFLYFSDEEDAFISFDIDTETGGGSGESSPPYTVALGTITTSDTRVSGTTDGVQMIVAEAESNAPGGMVVTVRNANGGNGMASTSVPADNINSADGTMADGTENYGLCVATAGLTGFSRASPYNSGSCAVNTETNAIQALTTIGENILDSGGSPLTGGHAQIIVNGAISTTTPAHNDYADALTFIATGTF